MSYTSAAAPRDQASVFCSHCGTPNAAGARFCASCGKGVGADADPAPSAFGGGQGHLAPAGDLGSTVWGYRATATVEADTAAVLAHARQVITKRNGTVSGQSADALSGTARYLFVLNLFIPAWFDVRVTASPAGGNRTTLSASATFDLASSVPLAAVTIIFASLGLLGGQGGGGILWVPVNLAISVGVQKFLAYLLVRELTRVRPGFAQAAPPPFRDDMRRPEPTPERVADPRAAPQPAPDPYGDLERLAKLRDIGAITADEYDRKKADVLARL